MDIIVIAAVIGVVAVVWAVGLWRTVSGDGWGRRQAPRHAHAHWSGGGSSSLPDTPYRALDRVA